MFVDRVFNPFIWFGFYCSIALASGIVSAQEDTSPDLGVVVVVGQEAYDEIVVYNALIEEWLETASFKASYTVVRGFAAADFSVNLTSLLPENCSGTQYKAHGHMVKLGRAVRHSKIYDCELSQPAVENEFQNQPYDEISHGEVWLRHEIEGSSVRLDGMHPAMSGVVGAGIFSRAEISPLAIIGGKPQSPFTWPIEQSLVIPDAVKIEKKGDVSKVTMSFKFGPEEVDLLVEVRTDISPPLVVRQERTVTGANYSQRVIAMVDEIAACSVGQIPKTFRLFESNPSSQSNDSDAWIYYLWSSADMGTAEPTEHDFDMKIPTGTRLVGFTNSKPYVDSGVVPFMSLTPNDIGQPAPSGPDNTPLQSAGGNSIQWLVGTNIVLFAFGAAYFMLRRRAR